MIALLILAGVLAGLLLAILDLRVPDGYRRVGLGDE